MSTIRCAEPATYARVALFSHIARNMDGETATHKEWPFSASLWIVVVHAVDAHSNNSTPVPSAVGELAGRAQKARMGERSTVLDAMSGSMAPIATGNATAGATKRQRPEQPVSAFLAVVAASPISVITGCSPVWLDESGLIREDDELGSVVGI